MMPMFLIDHGVPTADVGLWTGVVGQAVSIAGSVIGGAALSSDRFVWMTGKGEGEVGKEGKGTEGKYCSLAPSLFLFLSLCLCVPLSLSLFLSTYSNLKGIILLFVVSDDVHHIRGLRNN